MRDTDCEGERFFDGCEYHRISVDWKFYRCKSRVYTVPQTNQQSYRVNRFRIKIVGWRRREEESKSASSPLLFDIGEVFSSNRPNPRDRV